MTLGRQQRWAPSGGLVDPSSDCPTRAGVARVCARSSSRSTRSVPTEAAATAATSPPACRRGRRPPRRMRDGRPRPDRRACAAPRHARPHAGSRPERRPGPDTTPPTRADARPRICGAGAPGCRPPRAGPPAAGLSATRTAGHQDGGHPLRHGHPGQGRCGHAPNGRPRLHPHAEDHDGPGGPRHRDDRQQEQPPVVGATPRGRRQRPEIQGERLVRATSTNGTATTRTTSAPRRPRAQESARPAPRSAVRAPGGLEGLGVPGGLAVARARGVSMVMDGLLSRSGRGPPRRCRGR